VGIHNLEFIVRFVTRTMVPPFWMNCQPGNVQNGGNALVVATLLTDSELGTPISYLNLIVTIALYHLISEE